MGDKKDVWQGTLALMVLKTLEALGPLHGYGIARRIEQTSGDLLSVNYGTLYPALLNWNRKATSLRSGASRTIIARRSITSLRVPATSNLKGKHAIGNRLLRSSRDFSLRRSEPDETEPQPVDAPA